MRGPVGCVECGAPLCTACAGFWGHRRCPACNVQAGRPAHLPGVAWRRALVVDSARAVVRQAPRRLLVPLAAAVALAGVTSWTAQVPLPGPLLAWGVVVVVALNPAAHLPLLVEAPGALTRRLVLGGAGLLLLAAALLSSVAQALSATEAWTNTGAGAVPPAAASGSVVSALLLGVVVVGVLPLLRVAQALNLDGRGVAAAVAGAGSRAAWPALLLEGFGLVVVLVAVRAGGALLSLMLQGGHEGLFGPAVVVLVGLSVGVWGGVAGVASAATARAVDDHEAWSAVAVVDARGA